MKRKALTLISIMSTLLLIAIMIPKVTSFTVGPTIGSTGSIGDNGITCVQCHASNNNWEDYLITSPVLVDGYQYTVPYLVTAKIKKSGVTKFGFQVTCEDVNGDKQGTPKAATGSTTTQVVATFYITHTEAGTAFNDSAEWVFQWTAPSSNRGILTFYGAFNASNSNDQNTGDLIYVSEFVTFPYGTQGVSEDSENGNKFYIFPNPASDFFNVDLVCPDVDAVMNIYNINGAVVKTVKWDRADRIRIDIADLSCGTYIVKIIGKKDSYTQKLIVSR